MENCNINISDSRFFFFSDGRFTIASTKNSIQCFSLEENHAKHRSFPIVLSFGKI